MKTIREGCAQFHVPGNSDQETVDLYTAISQVSKESGVDSRFILAVALQESAACVRAPTSNYGVRNPGIMQSHNGRATCNGAGVLTPCPAARIVEMIRDGVQGTPSGDGLLQLLSKAPGTQDTKFFAAARMYNSGSLHASGDLEKGIATHCYVSDVANRLVGWVRSEKQCFLDGQPAPALGGSDNEYPSLASLGVGGIRQTEAEFGSAPGAPAPTTPSPASDALILPLAAEPSVLPEPEPADTAPTRAPEQPIIAPLIPVETKQRATSNKLAPGVTRECSEYYRVEGGDFCLKVGERFGVSFARLRELNTALDAECSNLWLDYDYCVKAL
jgi:hypothetical protein